MRQHSPGAAAPQDVEDGVQDLAQRASEIAAAGREAFGQARLNPLPLGVGQVSRVGVPLGSRARRLDYA